MYAITCPLFLLIYLPSRKHGSTIPSKILSFYLVRHIDFSDPTTDLIRESVASQHTSQVAVKFENQISNVFTIYLSVQDMYVAVIYRAPRTPHNYDNSLINFIDSFSYGRNVLILEDFNLPSLNWTGDIAPTDLNAAARDRQIYDCFLRNGLTQVVQDSTHKAGGTLHLILLSHLDRLIKISTIAPFPSCDHYPMVLSLSSAI